MLTRLTRAAVALLVALPAGAGAQVFARVTAPDAIVVDLDGNVLVHRDEGNRGTFLTRFAPDGLVSAQVLLQGAEFVQSRLTIDPGSGDILLLSHVGRIVRFDSRTLDSTEIVDLQNGNASAFASVFDVGTGELAPLTAAFPVLYGGIAARRRDARTLEIFVTGVNAGSAAYPLVERVLVDLVTNAIDVRAIATIKTGDVGLGLERRRAIAVSPQGTVVTTFPQPPASGRPPSGAGDSSDALIRFGAEFPDDLAAARPAFLSLARGPLDVDARGMAVDPAGGFFVASGVGGSSTCGQGNAGQLLKLSAALDAVDCVTLDSLAGPASGVAVGPSGEVFAIVSNPGLVVRAPPIIEASQTAAVAGKSGCGHGAATAGGLAAWVAALLARRFRSERLS